MHAIYGFFHGTIYSTSGLGCKQMESTYMHGGRYKKYIDRIYIDNSSVPNVFRGLTFH